MNKRQQNILLGVIGGLIVIAFVAVGVWVFTSVVDNESMNESGADRVFDEIRTRFAGAKPVVDLRPEGVVLLRHPPEGKPASPLKTLHVLRWNVQDERMTRVDLPFSLLRMRDSPLQVQTDPDSSGRRMSMSICVEDVERYGSALLVDNGLPDGGHVLVWSD
jgi:hypothetical protein